jgi:DNA-directed RNA polymerase subunit K
MLERLEKQFTKYEVARILGARALQIAMDAPLLLKIGEKELEEINYNPIEIAKMELEQGVLPITVNKPLPRKRETKIKKLSKEEIEEIKKREEEKREKELAIKKESGKEVAETTEIEEKAAEDSEMMELASPEDEAEEASESSGEEEGV